MAKGGYVYIQSNRNRTALHIGVTSNLSARSYDHKNMQGSKFTIKYRCVDLVFYEFHQDIESAIKREKQLKNWKRVWKEDLIKSLNPKMKDLYHDVRDMC